MILPPEPPEALLPMLVQTAVQVVFFYYLGHFLAWAYYKAR